MKETHTDQEFVLISKYLNHEADEAETQQVESWIAASEENRIEFYKLRKTWELASSFSGFSEIKASSNKEMFLLRVIGSMVNTRAMTGKKVALTFRTFLRYAAAILLIAGITASLVFLFSKDKNQIIQSYSRITASRGSKTIMELPDGSKVWLNAGSTLKYSNLYDNRERELFLEGEGYFEVEKRNGLPFIVHAGDIAVQATGTAFNVKAYPEEDVIETTLVEGSVTVVAENKPGNRISLSPNEQVNYYKAGTENGHSGNFLIMKGVKPELSTSWINDQLIISNETLASIAVKLGRKYDVVFHFEDNSLKELRFTGVLNNETIEQILEILKISSPVKYKIEKREIWLMHD